MRFSPPNIQNFKPIFSIGFSTTRIYNGPFFRISRSFRQSNNAPPVPCNYIFLNTFIVL